MKYIVILGDGMADEPIAALGDRTPLEVAETRMMDLLAPVSEIGLAKTIPQGMKPGSDTANLAVLGYDPKVYYSGRSPLEALSIGVPMKDTDIALRCNIVTISEEDVPFEEKTIIDHSQNQAAEMMVNGTVMGINELTAMINEKENLTEEVASFIQEILDLEEDYEQRLKKFL